MKKLFAFIILSISLMSCGKFDDGTSIWSEGLWILPLATFLAAVFFGYKAWKSHTGGSNIIDAGGRITDKEGGNMPLTQIGFFWFSVGFSIATIGILIWQNLEK